jgi:DNA polymerase-3 subunit gamma/tau
MTYVALARKYRPQNFDELVGESIIAETLKNAIKLQRISHAYLFSGPRGTGKTSTARILAKAVNCKNTIDANPCCKCDICEEITNGSSIDVIEIDGASNRGIDEIRQLRESARFMPAKHRYKIYIIDEVHMLTEPAFNALLKILEEPPVYVIFIMATTDPHRIPATILSRCQIYYFNKIKTTDMKAHLISILNRENVTFEEDAIYLIIKNADGCMRDALSLVDQVIAYTNGHLTYDTLYQLLGFTERDVVFRTLKALLGNEGREITTICDEINNKGLEYTYFIEQLIFYIKYLICYLYRGSFLEGEITMEEEKILKGFLPLCHEQKLFLLFQILLKLSNDIKLYSFDRIVFEIGLFKAVNADKLIPINLASNEKNNTTLVEKKGNTCKDDLKKTTTKEEDEPTKSKELIEKIDNESWRELLNKLGKTKPNLSVNLSYGYIDIANEETLHVHFNNTKKFHYQFVKRKENFEYIKRLVYSHFGYIKNFDILLDKDSIDERKSVIEEVKELHTYREVKIKKEIEESPIIKKIIETFDGKIENINIQKKEDLYEYTTDNETGTEGSREDERSSGEPW